MAIRNPRSPSRNVSKRPREVTDLAVDKKSKRKVVYTKEENIVITIP